MKRSSKRQSDREKAKPMDPRGLRRLGLLRARRATMLKKLARLDIQIKGLRMDAPWESEAEEPGSWLPDMGEPD